MARKSKRTKSADKYEEIEAPDGGYGWVVLFSVFAISFIMDGCMYSFGIIMTEIKKQFDISQQQTNLIYSINTGLQFCSGTLAASLAAEFGVRKVVIFGAIINTIVNVSVAFVPSSIYIIIIYGVFGGISFGLTYLTGFILLVKYFKKKLGKANGLTMAGSGLGAFATPQITKYFINNYDWKFTMVINACIIVQCVVMGALLRPLPKKKVKETLELAPLNPTPNANDVDEITLVKNESEGNQNKLRWYQKNKLTKVAANVALELVNFKILLQSPKLTLMSMSNFCIFFVYFIPFVFIPIRANDVIGDRYPWVISVIGIVNIPSRILIGIIADKKILSAVELNTIFMLLATLSIAAYYFLTSFWSQIVFAVFYAIAIAGTNCLATPYIVEIVGSEKYGNANGIVSIFRGVSCVIGPIIAGIIYDKTQKIFYPFLFTTIFYILAFIFSLSVVILAKFQLIRQKIISIRGRKSFEPTTET